MAVVVLGNHPAALAAALTFAKAGVSVLAVDVGTTPQPDRLVTVNPALFSLLPGLADGDTSLATTEITAVHFHRADGGTATTTGNVGKALKPIKGRNDLAGVACERDLIDRLRTMAEAAGAKLAAGSVTAESIDESGLALKCARQTIRPKLMVAADPLPDDLAQAVKARSSAVSATSPSVQAIYEVPPKMVAGEPGVLHMALDLGNAMAWGWLLRAETARGPRAQLQIQHASGEDSTALLREWAARLRAAKVLKEDLVDGRSVRTFPLTPAGALQRDVVVRRTLLAGPAGGFYSASGEDVYPACWSAILAAEVATKALKADHVQDALGAYRSKWGASLGEYLQGPQQNLRFLLPLVFKNPVMTDRLAEAILRGQSLVK